MKPFTNLNKALDALADAELSDILDDAKDDLATAEICETMENFATVLACAARRLQEAMNALAELQARCLMSQKDVDKRSGGA